MIKKDEGRLNGSFLCLEHHLEALVVLKLLYLSDDELSKFIREGVDPAVSRNSLIQTLKYYVELKIPQAFNGD